MRTKLIKAIGPHDNPNNLSTIAYCIESPKKVLEFLLNQGYMIGGYRQAGMTRCMGEGIIIRGTDMEPLPFGLKVIGKVNEIPLDKYSLVKKPYRSYKSV